MSWKMASNQISATYGKRSRGTTVKKRGGEVDHFKPLEHLPCRNRDLTLAHSCSVLPCSQDRTVSSIMGVHNWTSNNRHAEGLFRFTWKIPLNFWGSAPVPTQQSHPEKSLCAHSIVEVRYLEQSGLKINIHYQQKNDMSLLNMANGAGKDYKLKQVVLLRGLIDVPLQRILCLQTLTLCYVWLNLQVGVSLWELLKPNMLSQFILIHLI